jgi:hypothetical protein
MIFYYFSNFYCAAVVVLNIIVDINKCMKLFAILALVFRTVSQIMPEALIMMQTISCPEY